LSRRLRMGAARKAAGGGCRRRYPGPLRSGSNGQKQANESRPKIVAEGILEALLKGEKIGNLLKWGIELTRRVDTKDAHRRPAFGRDNAGIGEQAKVAPLV